jgi:SSU ribosomal protein S5P
MKAVTKIRGKRIRIDAAELAIEEKLLDINRVTKVVKGGKNLSFRALMVVGDGKGHVGSGLAKATEVPEAIHKAGAMARKGLIEVPIVNGTIPHEILAKFGASKILLKPAAPGTGVVASNTARAVLELAGIKDILSKSLGSSSKINVVKATMIALANLKKPKEAEVIPLQAEQSDLQAKDFTDETDAEVPEDKANETK